MEGKLEARYFSLGWWIHACLDRLLRIELFFFRHVPARWNTRESHLRRWVWIIRSYNAINGSGSFIMMYNTILI